MKLSDITASLVEETGVEKAVVVKIVDGLLAKIKSAAEAGEKVNVPGLGTFLVKERVAGEVVSPKSGALKQVSAARFIALKPTIAGVKSKKAAKAKSEA